MGIGLCVLPLAACNRGEQDTQRTAGSEILDERPLSPDTEKILLSGPPVGAAVIIEPPGQDKLAFIIEETEPAGQGTSYLGHVDGAAGSSGTITVVGGTIAGAIRVLGQPVYQFARGQQGPVIRAIDPQRLPPDHPDMQPDEGGKTDPPGPGQTGDTCTTDDPSRVSLMIVYTTGARMRAGGTTEAIEASIYAAIAEANRSYVNSDVGFQLELVHMEEVPYVAVGGNFMTDVCRLHDTGDGFLDDIPAKRNLYRADLVAMVVDDDSGACGLTYGQLLDPTRPCTDGSNHDVVRSPGNVHEEGAYHVFALSCIQTNFTLPHELGHSASARHNWGCDGSDLRPRHDNHDFFYDDGTPTGSWRTILTYPINPFCTGHGGPRVPYFSNPAISFAGHPTGTTAEPQPADNHNQLNATRGVLANYRCSAPSPGNVWMKDTWGDTGAEPDTDPDIMYASPYVWTRNTADTLASGTTDRYQHEHEHENPRLHTPTWGYVKLHNGSSVGAAGHVKLYYANASTSLAWPGAWTEIGDVPVTASAFPAGSTKVVQIPWADPPGLGHYCLTARWESTTDPIPPETTDIDANTRRSNNVIWRNLEILPMGTGDIATSQFIVRPFGASEMTLVIASPGRRPFLPQGEIEIKFSANTQFIAKPDQGVVQLEPGRFRVVANGGRIKMMIPDPKGEVVASVWLHRTTAQEHRNYRVAIDQLERRDGGVEASVGGVAYDLQP